MNEPIGKALALAGINMEFQNFEIQGIPGFHFSILLKGERSPYEVEKQNFSFQISTEDFVENSITEDLTFSIENSIYLYTFKIERFIDDLLGWTLLYTNFISKTLT